MRRLEAVTERGPGAMALVDAAHWATEAPWLDAVALRLRAELRHYGGRSRLTPRHRSVDAARPLSRNESDQHVNADHAAQLRLLDLQAADTALAQLAHRRATLPELAALADRDQRADALHNDIVDAQTRADDVAAEQRGSRTMSTRSGLARRATSSGCRPAGFRRRNSKACSTSSPHSRAARPPSRTSSSK